MTERNVRKLTEIHRLVGKAWAQGGIVTGNDPCVEDRARQVGLSTRVLHRHGIGARWNDKQPTRTGARNVQRALKRAIAREGGGCLQTEPQADTKKTRKGRQHMGAAPVLVLAVALVLTVILVHVVLLAVLGLMAFSVGVWVGQMAWDVIGDQNWGYVFVWLARRRAHRVAVESRQAEVIGTIDARESLFALPAGQTIEAMPAWLHKEPEREHVSRLT